MVATREYLMAPEEKDDIHNAGVSKTEDFDDDAAEADAKVLRKAMKGWGTDENPIIDIFTKRTSEELQKVADKYKASFGRELMKDLKSELSGNLEKAIVGRLYTGPEFDAWHLRQAMKGLGTKEETLIDIIMPKTTAQLKLIKDSYKAQFDRDLEEDVKSECTGDLERLLLSMLACGREEESEAVDDDKAESEAKELYDAGEGCWGTDEGTFNRIMSLRSFKQLKVMFRFYRVHAGRDIREAIKKEFQGDMEKAYLAMVDNIRDTEVYYANVLKSCMDGAGTDDDTLIRILQSRCEYDVIDIADAYKKMTGDHLKERVKKETRGDYEKTLVGLLTPN